MKEYAQLSALFFKIWMSSLFPFILINKYFYILQYQILNYFSNPVHMLLYKEYRCRCKKEKKNWKLLNVYHYYYI